MLEKWLYPHCHGSDRTGVTRVHTKRSLNILNFYTLDFSHSVSLSPITCPRQSGQFTFFHDFKGRTNSDPLTNTLFGNGKRNQSLSKWGCFVFLQRLGETVDVLKNHPGLYSAQRPWVIAKRTLSLSWTRSFQEIPDFRLVYSQNYDEHEVTLSPASKFLLLLFLTQSNPFSIEPNILHFCSSPRSRAQEIFRNLVTLRVDIELRE